MATEDATGDGANPPPNSNAEPVQIPMVQLQSMITSSIQAALPSLESAIATRVSDSLKAQGMLFTGRYGRMVGRVGCVHSHKI